MFVMAYGFCDCWIPLASDQHSFTMLSFIWEHDVSSLSDRSVVVGLETLLMFTHTHTHMENTHNLFVSFSVPHINKNTCLCDSKGPLVILFGMERVSLASLLWLICSQRKIKLLATMEEQNWIGGHTENSKDLSCPTSDYELNSFESLLYKFSDRKMFLTWNIIRTQFRCSIVIVTKK